MSSIYSVKIHVEPWIQLTQDGAEVECKACTFTYKSNKTPTVTGVTKAPKDSGLGYTITITGTNLCPWVY